MHRLHLADTGRGYTPSMNAVVMMRPEIGNQLQVFFSRLIMSVFLMRDPDFRWWIAIVKCKMVPWGRATVQVCALLVSNWINGTSWRDAEGSFAVGRNTSGVQLL